MLHLNPVVVSTGVPTGESKMVAVYSQCLPSASEQPGILSTEPIWLLALTKYNTESWYP